MKNTALILIACTGLMTGCAREEPLPPPVRPVVTQIVEEPGGMRERTFSGTAKAAVETRLSFRVSGELRELPLKTGQRVKKGDLIARLDVTDFQLQVNQLEAQLAQSQAGLNEATADYERNRALYEAESVSKSDLDRARAAFESAAAQHDATGQSLKLARQQFGYCTLLAPVNGSVATVPIENHQTVQAGAVVATLTSGDEMELEVGIPESLISSLQAGDAAEITFDSFQDRRFASTVSEVGVDVDASSTYPVTLRLLDQSREIRPGMVGAATFTFSDGPDAQAMVVPSVAVVGRGEDERFVWVYQPETSTVVRRDVRVGALTSRGLQILAGLQPGDRIVTRGVHRIEEGTNVRLLEE